MAKQTDNTRRHVLVINDTPELLALFQELLEEEGYRVSLDAFVGDVGTKLREVERCQPDLIILDFIIGGEGTGWQFLQALRMNRRTTHIPVIVCTAAVDQIRQLQGQFDSLGVGVVLKPFDIDHLLAEVARVWDRHGQGNRATPPG